MSDTEHAAASPMRNADHSADPYAVIAEQLRLERMKELEMLAQRPTVRGSDAQQHLREFFRGEVASQPTVESSVIRVEVETLISRRPVSSVRNSQFFSELRQLYSERNVVADSATERARRLAGLEQVLRSAEPRENPRSVEQEPHTNTTRQQSSQSVEPQPLVPAHAAASRSNRPERPLRRNHPSGSRLTMLLSRAGHHLVSGVRGRRSGPAVAASLRDVSANNSVAASSPVVSPLREGTPTPGLQRSDTPALRRSETPPGFRSVSTSEAAMILRRATAAEAQRQVNEEASQLVQQAGSHAAERTLRERSLDTRQQELLALLQLEPVRRFLEDDVQRSRLEARLRGNRAADWWLQAQNDERDAVARLQGLNYNQASVPQHLDGAEDFEQAFSVISSTANIEVPAAASQESVRALQTQMVALMEMVRALGRQQMEMNRVVRQDMAALVAAQDTPGRPTSRSLASTSTALPRAETAGDCLICLGEAADVVLYSCGHMCTCSSCALRLQQRKQPCPVCRAPIRDILKIYKP